MGISQSVSTAAWPRLNRTLAVMLAIFLALILASGLQRPAMANPKFAAITVDAATGEIIYANDADARRYPASLTKVMTLYILFQELKANRVRFDTQMKVSAKASKQQPSKLGLRAGSTLSVRDAIFSLITKSANDAAMVVAEHVSGSEDAFADRMTRTARGLGMTRTTFTNPNGLPDSRQVTTARDMATLGLRVQRDFPDYYKFFATRSYSYGKRRLGNHNRLLGKVKGVDGIKTGYTRASGFNLLSSMEVNNRRIVGVVLGGTSGASRNAYMTKMLRRDIAKATVSGNAIAAVAGKPAGYNPAAAAKVVALAKPQPPIENPPKPRMKPEDLGPAAQPVSTSELAQIVARTASQPVPANEPAPEALPANGVTFQTVTVPMATQKSDSLIVASAAQALAPAPTSLGKLQLRLEEQEQQGSAPVEQVVAATAPAPAIAKVIVDQQVVQEKLAAHQQSWNIQVGAFPTAEGAKSRIDVAKSTRVSALRDATPFLMAVDKDGDTIYRARFSGLNRREAQNACRQLKRAGVGCFPLAPSS